MNKINTAAILLVVSAAFTLQAETIPTRQMYASSGDDFPSSCRHRIPRRNRRP